MPTPVPQNTDLATILAAARDKLVADGVFAASACFLTLNPDDLRFPPSDQFAAVCPGPQRINTGVYVGGGRDIVVVEGQLTVSLWCRLALDQQPRDDSYLTDATLGALRRWRCVVNSLLLYQPLDGGGNQLLPKGFKWEGLDSYSRDYQGVGWGCLKSSFSFE